MTFLQPALLVALPAVFLPLIIHLLHRQRFKKKDWGAMRFLREALEEQRGRRRLRHWWILAARMLALAALVLAVARPLVGGWLAGWVGGHDRTLFLVLDRSLSMERELSGGGETKRGAAMAHLTEALETLRPTSLWVLDTAHGVPERVEDWATYQGEMGATQSEANLSEALLTSFQKWESLGESIGECWVVSDGQASSWRTDHPEQWADVEAAYRRLTSPPKLRLLTFPEGAPNRAIRCRVKRGLLQGTILQGQESEVVRLPLTLIVGEQERVHEVEVSGRSTTFEIAMPERASITGLIRLPADGNAADNVAHFAVAEERPPRVGLQCEDPDIQAILALAADPLGEIAVETTVNAQSQALVICQGALPEEIPPGTHWLCFPPIDAAFETSETTLRIARWDQQVGPLRDTRNGDALPLASMQTFRYVPRGVAEQGRLWATLANGQPWLWQSPHDDGRVVTSCVTLPQEDWSTLGDGLVLVPLVQRLIDAGQERFARVRWKPVTEAPWDVGVAPEEGGWTVWQRPFTEDDTTILAEEILADLVGDLPLEPFALSSGESSAESSEWWRLFLVVALAFLLMESILTKVPVRARQEPSLPR